MKTKTLLFTLLLLVSIFNCSKHIEYSEGFKKEATGKYLFNPDDVIEVFFENNKLFLKWRGAVRIEPVVLDENEFFMVDLYKKLRFVQHPETNKRYLSIISEENPAVITYDYPKVSDSFKTPSQYLEEKNYEKALEGFLEVKKKDSTSGFIEERDFNTLGYKHLKEKKYKDAIEVLKLNVVLHPTSDNVYDSLAHAYLMSGDSLLAYTNYKKALSLNNRNRRAQGFIKDFEAKKE